MRRTLIVAFAAALVIAPTAGAWTWPVKGPILQKFVLGDDPYAAGQHRGIDIGAGAGEPVLAPASGTVSFAGTVPVSGKVVTIQTADGYSVTLTHLGSTSVRRGETVGEEAVVGTIGPTGEVEHDVPYVHLGIRRSEDPNGYIDPLLFPRLRHPFHPSHRHRLRLRPALRPHRPRPFRQRPRPRRRQALPQPPGLRSREHALPMAGMRRRAATTVLVRSGGLAASPLPQRDCRRFVASPLQPTRLRGACVAP
jgi:murein DD-endopeptidase MepM/ murein hydrolase activator NlpD